MTLILARLMGTEFAKSILNGIGEGSLFMQQIQRQRADHWALVLAAGDGTRLQSYILRLKGKPLPKQFVNLIGRRSMLEHTFDRVEKLIAREQILTIVGKHHLELDEVRRQLAGRRQDTVIVQPANKETGPGILLPLIHLYKRYPEAIVSVFPSDHFVLEENRFMDHVDIAVKAVTCDPSRIVILGAEARSSEIEYGYVLPGENSGGFDFYGTRPVTHFIEKPAKEVASRIVSAGGLWNTMVMVFKVRTVLDMFSHIQPVIFQRFRMILDALGTPHEQDTIEQVYRNLQPINFSKGFLEHVAVHYPRVIYVLPVWQVFWSDWGSRQRVLETRQVLRKTVRSKTVAQARDVSNLGRPVFA
jgi:mannose-1-phosphate guanylyltransferase